MKHRLVAAAIAVLFSVSAPRGVAAKGGGHSGGGHSSGGHSRAGQPSTGSGGSVHTTGGHATGGRAPVAPGGATPAAPVALPIGGSVRPPDGHTVIGIAVPRSSGPRDLFVVTPSIYSPLFVRPHFIGFGFGIRPFGYGYGSGYYGFGYDQPLSYCQTMVDCDVAPVTGAVDARPYETRPPEAGSGSVLLEVEPSFAQIFVDDEYVGTVENFSATGLVMAAGVHHVEFRAPGCQPLVVDMRIAAGRRITYRGALKPPVP